MTMSKMWNALFLAPVALLLATGATECDAWSTVTVPSSDSTPPDVYDAIWWESEYIEIKNHDQPLTYHLAAGEEVLALGSGLDWGGTKKVTMTREWSWRCCTVGNICSITQSSATALTDTQPGGPGSTVQQGMWLGQSVEVPNLATLCNAGWFPTFWRFRWQTSAENYFGVKRTGPMRTAQWP
jgi:hypothetical protein